MIAVARDFHQLPKHSGMIKRLLNQIAEALTESPSSDAATDTRQYALRKATAVLMLDVALADKSVDDREVSRILELVEVRFELTKDDAAELVEAARDTAEDMVSLHEFTDALHKHMSDDEKANIMALLWEVAYVDGELDKHEDALILKIGDLLYVDRVRVMRGKHDAERAAAGR